MTFAIIAHDGKKPEMVDFLLNNKDHLKGINLLATSTTGSHVEEMGLDVQKMMSGPLGGDAQIAAQVAQNKVDAVFFFRDPMGKHPHEPDVQMLLRLCDVHNIPLATNPASAQYILKGVIR